MEHENVTLETRLSKIQAEHNEFLKNASKAEKSLRNELKQEEDKRLEIES